MRMHFFGVFAHAIIVIVALFIVPGNTLSGLSSSTPLKQQSRFGIKQRIENPVTVLDLVSVLCRFEQRYDFYSGDGYRRPDDGNLLTAARFYERIKDKPFLPEVWPLNTDGRPIGIEPGMDQALITTQLQKSPPTEEACTAIFTSFAKGASSGLAWPVQVDEEMAKWLTETVSSNGKKSRVFDQAQFEQSLLIGKLQVVVGWFLFVGLQGFAIYHLFLRPFVKAVLPDLYDVLY